MFVEATKMPGTGELTLTGQLGDVMKESAQIALNWVRSNSPVVSTSLVPSLCVPPGEKRSGEQNFLGLVPKSGNDQ